MPYTPPAGNAVTLNFISTTAYTPPLGSAVVLNFKPPGPVIVADPATYTLTGTNAAVRYNRRTSTNNLIINGDFSTSTTPWIVVGDDTTFEAVDDEGVLTLGAGASGGFVYQAVAVVPRGRYRLHAYLDPNSSTRIGFGAGTSIGGTQLGFKERSFPRDPTQLVVRFTGPSSGMVYVVLYTSAELSCSGVFDDIRLIGPAPDDPSTIDYGIYTITGSDATLTKTTRSVAADVGSYVTTGSLVSLKVGLRIVADSSIYTQTRTDAGLRIGRRLVADPGSYAMSVSSADITHITGLFLHAEKGAYALQGSDVRLIYGRRLVAAPGSHSITGTDVSWVYRRMIEAAPDAYAFTGANVQLRVGYRLAAQPGAYMLTGSDIDLINRRLIADPGAHALVGSAAGLRAGRRLQATPGAHTITGTSALLLSGRRFIAMPGSYSLLGSDATVRAGRRLVGAAGVYTLTGAAARLLRGYTVNAVPGVYVLMGAAARVVTTRRMITEGGVYRAAWPDVALTYHRTPSGPRSIAVGFAASRYLHVSMQNRRVGVISQTRRIAVEPAARRYAAVEPRDKEPEGGSMLQWPEKDPNEVLDYQLDWADPEDPRLEASESLLTSVWSVVEGDVVIDMGLTTFTAGGLSTVWLSAGTPAMKCILLNRVTTSKGRTYDKSVVLRVRNH